MTDVEVSQLRLCRGQKPKKDGRRGAKGMRPNNTLYSKYFNKDGTPKKRMKQQ